MTDLSELKQLIVDSGNEWRKLDADLTALGQTVAELQNAQKLGEYFPRGSRSARADGSDPRLGEAVRLALLGDDRELKSMSAGDDSAGGYMVVPQMDNRVRLIRDRVSPLSSLCRTIELREGGEALLPRVNGTLASGWVGETESRPVTDSLPVGLDRIELHEVYANPQATQKLLDTATYDVGALMVDVIGHGLAVAEDIALHTGNGVGRPRGLTTYTTAATADGSRTWGVIEHIPTGASGGWHTNGADPLFDTVAALAPQYRANARWLMNRATLASIRKLRDATGDNYLWIPGLVAGEPDRLLGHPVVLSENVPTIAANALAIYFGDLEAAYTIVRMPGLRLLRDPYSTKGYVGFYAYQRVGGGLVDSSAIKAVKFAAA